MSILFPDPAPASEVAPPPREPRRFSLGRRARRGLRLALTALLVLAVAWAGALAYVNSDGFKRPLQERVRRELNERTELVELGDHLEIDWLGRVRVGPISVRGAPKDPPFLEIPRVRVRPSYRGLLAGRVLPASITLVEPTLRLGRRAEALRAFVDSLQEARPRSKPTASKETPPPRERSIALFAERLRVFGGAGDAIALTRTLDASLIAQQDEGGDVSARGRVLFHEGGRALLTLQERSGHYTVDAELTGLTPAAFDDALWEAVPVQLDRGRLDVTAHFEGADIVSPAKASLRIAARDAWLSGARLSARPVGPASFGFHADFAWVPKERRIRMEPARAWLGAEDSVFVGLRASVQLGKARAFDVEAKLDGIPFEKVLAALPAQVRPDEGAPTARGPLRASLAIRGAFNSPETWEVEPLLDLDDLQPVRRGRNLLASFEHTAVDAQGRTRNLVIAEDSGLFVPLAALPEYVVRSVLTSEDAGFYGHDGFEFTEIHDSLIAAVRGTRFRGASTLTQQLAKNLFLSREKVLTRKVEEALITLALEVSVPKDRLLEIYLNLIEWGPNLYGLREASRHYFGVEPQQLSPKQAVFLATIIPNPNRYYGYYLKGQLTPAWEERVRTLLTKLRDAGYLDEGRYQAAVAETLVFHREAAHSAK